MHQPILNITAISMILTYIALNGTGCTSSAQTIGSQAVELNTDCVLTGRVLLPDGRKPLMNATIDLRDFATPHFSLAPGTGPIFAKTSTDNNGMFKFNFRATSAFRSASERGSLVITVTSLHPGTTVSFKSVVGVYNKPDLTYTLEKLGQ